MRYVTLPDADPRRGVPFYLAMEEVVARRYAAGTDNDFFFMWQVAPSVICGRHQWIDTEVDLDYCAANDIMVRRRRSGGGAVFADLSNIMFSYVTPGDEVVTTFGRYTSMVAAFLRSLGLDSSATTRNDIMIGDRKVSGSAFYHVAGASIAHGTMLYDTDPTHMSKALTPSRAKLESKGVKSVTSRITTIRSHRPDLSIEEFMRLARMSMCGDEELRLTQDDVDAIRRIEATYLDPAWIAPRRAHGAGLRRQRVEGVGEFAADVVMAPGGDVIAGVTLSGDFFETADTVPLLARLEGVRADRDAVIAALGDTGGVIPGMTPETLAEIILAGIKQDNSSHLK